MMLFLYFISVVEKCFDTRPVQPYIVLFFTFLVTAFVSHSLFLFNLDYLIALYIATRITLAEWTFACPLHSFATFFANTSTLTMRSPPLFKFDVQLDPCSCKELKTQCYYIVPI